MARKASLQALELSIEWTRLLTVVTWLVEHPRPGIYLRQVDLPGIHSKFIETLRGVLAELLDLTLPVDAVDTCKTGISQFPGLSFRAKFPGDFLVQVTAGLHWLAHRLQLLDGATAPDSDTVP